MATRINDLQEIIPLNPAAFDFEVEMRMNMDILLDTLKGFENRYEDSFTALQGSATTLEEAVGNIVGTPSVARDAIIDALVGNGGSKKWIQGNIEVDSGLEYSSLSERFDQIDSTINGKASLNGDLSKDFNVKTLKIHDNLDANGRLIKNLQGPFSQSDAATKKYVDDETKKRASLGGSSTQNFQAYQMDIFAGLDMNNRSITNLANPTSGQHPVTLSYLQSNYATSSLAGSNFASKNGSAAIDFNAAILKIGTRLDLDSKPLINLAAPKNDADASTKKYVDDKILTRALRDGDSTRLFKVKNVDPSDSSHDNQHALSYGYAIANLANIAGNTTQDFDAQTLTVSAGLDMNSQFITNLPDPTANDHAVNLNYLTANYTNTTDLGNNYAAIAGSATQDFDIQKLTVHDDVDMNSKLITNLPNPTGAGHAVNYDYLTANYTNNNALALSYAGINGSAGQAFDILDPNDDTDTSQDTWAISRTFADGRYAKQEGDATINFNADTLTVNSLVLASDLNMAAGKTIKNLPKPLAADSSHAKYAVNREYVDDVQVMLSNLIGSVSSNMVPTYGTPEDGKFLSVSSSGLIWVNPPTVDTSTPSYEWLSHPQVAFHSVQFEEQLYIDHTLKANRVYFIAGNLEFPEKMADGITNCTSKLTLDSGHGTNKGATLIVQGHIVGDITRLIEDYTYQNPPRIIVQNWADSRADYVISGTVNTSDLNLTEDLFFASRLVLESGAVLNIDSDCNLTFKELVNKGGTINETKGSVNYFNSQRLGGYSYIDPSSNSEGYHIYKFSGGSVNYLNAQGLGGFTYINPSSNSEGYHIYKFSPREN